MSRGAIPSIAFRLRAANRSSHSLPAPAWSATLTPHERRREPSSPARIGPDDLSLDATSFNRMTAHDRQMEGIMGELPNAVVKRLLTKHGSGLRVSGSALDRAVAATEDYIARLAAEASASADGAKRKTLMDSDIDAARTKLSI